MSNSGALCHDPVNGPRGGTAIRGPRRRCPSRIVNQRVGIGDGCGPSPLVGAQPGPARAFTLFGGATTVQAATATTCLPRTPPRSKAWCADVMSASGWTLSTTGRSAPEVT
jgi:hypothetical protein